MEPLSFQLARELAEEIRTNTKLRHRLGLEEGDESAVLNGEAENGNAISLQTRDGNEFFIRVEEA